MYFLAMKIEAFLLLEIKLHWHFLISSLCVIAGIVAGMYIGVYESRNNSVAGYEYGVSDAISAGKVTPLMSFKKGIKVLHSCADWEVKNIIGEFSECKYGEYMNSQESGNSFSVPAPAGLKEMY